MSKEVKVILVDQFDNEIGLMEKLEAHRQQQLHRAISVFIINSEGQWLLQQRHEGKYHSPSLWSNSCCSHPMPGEATIAAAARRLHYEMGIETNLRFLFHFIYKFEFENGLTEHEFDHVFLGISDTPPTIHNEEVSVFRYASFDKIDYEVQSHPHQFTPWFKLIYKKVNEHILSLVLTT